MVDGRFRVSTGWSDKFRAIIDPGSPHCIIPRLIWRDIEHRVLVSHPQSLGGTDGGSTSAPFGAVTLAIDDETILSPPLNVRAFLLPDDSEPLLLGFEDVLTRMILRSAYPRQTAYLKFPM